MVSANRLLQIITIPTRFLGIMILTLAFVAVYSMRNSITDGVVAAGFGVFGMILKRLNLPIVPIILGMVLGGMKQSGTGHDKSLHAMDKYFDLKTAWIQL
jgi:putative tricarboxylic transport membrane protein